MVREVERVMVRCLATYYERSMSGVCEDVVGSDTDILPKGSV